MIGCGVGPGHWQEALATAGEPELLVTDGETGIRELAGWYFPQTRQQLCEWHVPHSMAHILGLDGMTVAERTTRIMERELRAVNRRTDVGAR